MRFMKPGEHERVMEDEGKDFQIVFPVSYNKACWVDGRQAGLHLNCTQQD